MSYSEELKTNDARQGERMPGMFAVLAASTGLAVIALGICVAVLNAA
ncbi:hypothetical protein [Ponticaulis sp.]|nr:hypothetical protein [Ponticaulis sp.]|tara:strand:- start:10414 stop:10554 length:141 start_codon:yes stop_codon:yes gene_type:complete